MMSRITPVEGFLLNLEQKIEECRREYLPRDAAYEKLKSLTGEDFGYDTEKWRTWIKKHGLPRQRES